MTDSRSGGTSISIFQVYEQLQSLLEPVCTANGISLKAMPADADIGVVRSAMAVMFVPQVAIQSSTRAQDFAARRAGVLNFSAYVLALAASQIGVGSATWVTEVLAPVLDRAKFANGLSVQVDSIAFSSYKDGIWQYRIELSLSQPYMSSNVEADQDTANASTIVEPW